MHPSFSDWIFSMLLSVMIPALASRNWVAVVEELYRQRELYWLPDVEILVDVDAGQAKSGVKRQNLLVRARGDYLAFVDDDDEVAPDYLRRIVDGCRRGVDVVTFDLRFRSADWKGDEVWSFGFGPNDRKKGSPRANMWANHLCAWRQDVARNVAWCPELGNADDHLWFQPIHAAGLCRTRYHVDSVLYFYRYAHAVTTNQRRAAVDFRKRYVGDGLRCFFDEHGRIWIENGPPLRGPVTSVRNNQNLFEDRPVDSMKLFHVIKVPS